MAAERPDHKSKKEKKEKRSEESGISKSKKDKKEKKLKKEKLAAAAAGEKSQEAVAAQTKAAVRGEDEAPSDMDEDKQEEQPVLERKIVPFAVPLADDKGQKKICKTIRKAAKNGSLKRGVKEVVKTLRKSPASAPGYTGFPGLVVIAGDISPMDVISHIPVLCEDHNVPFIFVSSRAELGAAAKTKRPTSVVMIMEKAEGKKKPAKEAAEKGGEEEEEESGEAFGEAYASLVKYAQKEYAKQSFWAKGESKA